MIIEDHKIYKSIWLVGFLSYCLFEVAHFKKFSWMRSWKRRLIYTKYKIQADIGPLC